MKYLPLIVLLSFFIRCMFKGFNNVDVAVLAVLCTYTFFSSFFTQSENLAKFKEQAEAKLKSLEDNMMVMSKNLDDTKLAVTTVKLGMQKRI